MSNEPKFFLCSNCITTGVCSNTRVCALAKPDVESRDVKLRRDIKEVHRGGKLSVLSVVTGVPVEDLIDIAEGGEISTVNRIILEAAAQ